MFPPAKVKLTHAHDIGKDMLPSVGFVHDKLPAVQVAQSMLKGLLRGDYHLSSPDFGLNLLVAPMAGYSPRAYNTLLECFLAPIMVLIARILVPVADSVVKKERGW